MTEDQKTQEAKTERKIVDGQHPVQEGIVNAVQKTGNVFGEILKTVSEGVSSAAKSAGQAGVSVLEAVGNVVRSAVRGSLGVGSDLVMGTKAIVMGVIRGSGEKDEAALKTLSHTARTVIRQTAETNGDVGAAATGLVQGAIAGAKNMGVDPSRAASAAGTAAVEEADLIGSTAAGKVRVALKKDIAGIKVAIPEPAKK